jgi:valyl-tRNA synthetase
MIALYPEANQAYKNEASEVSMAHTVKVIEACRSLRASYYIAHKVQTHFFVKITGPSEAACSMQACSKHFVGF